MLIQCSAWRLSALFERPESTVPILSEVTQFLNDVAPVSLAEDWDNVGLLIGNDQTEVSTILTCLTLTPDVAAEAIGRKAQLVVSHHPLLFRPVQRLTAESVEGRMLLDLIGARVAVYSPHTGYDSAAEGINRQLAETLELTQVGVLRPIAGETRGITEVGGGRFGQLPKTVTLADFNRLVKQRLGIQYLQFVGRPDMQVARVAIACGSAAEFLRDAQKQGCHVLLTGEARFHACLEARALGMGLVLAGHYATERPAMERLAERLSERFPDLVVQASQNEADPVQWD